MKKVQISLIIVAAAAIIFGLSTASYAFHSGGVAECMGCHEMHDATGPSLLQGSDVSSTCLLCHGKSGASSYHIATPDADMPAGVPPGNMTPGGDFGWLKKDYFYSAHGRPGTVLGQTLGHNIIAADKGYTVDTDNPTAPGGTFNSNNLACNSCHDQHGQVRRLSDATFSRDSGPIIGSGSYDNSAVPAAGEAVGTYRLLRSSLSDQTHASGSPVFTNTPVVAFAPHSYNRSEFNTQTRVAYNNGVSEYCGSCHPDMHSTAGILRHPQGIVMPSAIVNNYNYYVSSGNMSGSSADSFLSLVPYEEGLAVNPGNIATLQSHAMSDDSVLTGPVAGQAKVMCLSCHRAHATAFPEMTRWDNETEFLIEGGVWTPNQGKNAVEEAAGYNNFNPAKFGDYQRSLCNKCHAKD